MNADGETSTVEDPYRFDSPLGDLDRYLLGEGSHLRLPETLGAAVTEMDGITGVHFAVWAPDAQRVSVVGPFNAKKRWRSAGFIRKPRCAVD